MFLCFQQNKRYERGRTQDLFRTSEAKRENLTVEWKRYSYCTTYLYNRGGGEKHAGWHKNILLTTDYECSIKAEQCNTHTDGLRSLLVASLAGWRVQAVCEIHGGSKSSSKLRAKVEKLLQTEKTVTYVSF